MNNKLKLLLLFLGFISSLAISIWLVQQVAFTEVFNLNDPRKINIGTALAGLTAPIIGIINVLFLYQAFAEQRQANIRQADQDNVDTILTLINNLNVILSDIAFNDASKGEHINYGAIAINKLFAKHLYEKNREVSIRDLKKTITWEGIIYLCDSIKNVETQINHRFKISHINHDMLSKQLMGFFIAKLEHPLRIFSEKFVDYDHSEAKKVVEFYNSMSKNKVTSISNIHGLTEIATQMY